MRCAQLTALCVALLAVSPAGGIEILDLDVTPSVISPDGHEAFDSLTVSFGIESDYSQAILQFCMPRSIPLIYASSAAVYGAGAAFGEEPANEAPLNVYGFSKLLFDLHVRRIIPDAESQIVGLRYFNVYGPRETHKGSMASMVRQLDEQLRETGKARLWKMCRIATPMISAPKNQFAT